MRVIFVHGAFAPRRRLVVAPDDSAAAGQGLVEHRGRAAELRSEPRGDLHDDARGPRRVACGLRRGRTPPWQIPQDDGTIGVRADLVRPLFAHDFDDTTVAAAAARLTRQSAVVFGQCPTAAAWQEIPSTYVICADDRATPPRSSARTPRGPRKWWSYRSPTIPSSPGRTCRPR